MVRRWLSKRKAALILIILAALLLVPAAREAHSESGSVVYLGASKYYANYSSACIFRVDDFVADPSELSSITFHIGNRTVTYQNFEMDLINYILKNHPEMRMVFGVITADRSGLNNSEIWSLYSELVRAYGWEAATHTRYHLLPPRTIDDLEGSIEDIEGNISGYRVLTYIPPYGKTDRAELELMRSLGIRIVMSDKPLQLNAPSHWYDMHITWKIDGKHSWTLRFLKPIIALNARIGGVSVIYTHATSFDWRSPSQMVSALNQTISTIESENTWITVPSELYKYSTERSHLSVETLNETSFRIGLKRPLDFQPIPVTLKFQVEGKVGAVYFNGTLLPRLDSPGFVPRPGYWQKGDILYVSVVPSGVLEIGLGETG